MALSCACMECQENIRANSSEALAAIVIAHYADNHYARYLDVPKTTDTRGGHDVLKERSIVTHPIAVSEE